MQGVAEDHWQDTYDARLVVPLVCSNPPSRVARHPSSCRTSPFACAALPVTLIAIAVLAVVVAALECRSCRKHLGPCWLMMRILAVSSRDMGAFYNISPRTPTLETVVSLVTCWLTHCCR